jgi:preprotein translocase subunit SecD
MKKLFTNTRIIILLVIILLAVVAINPRPWNEGAAIRAVAADSAAALSGIEAPTGRVQPVLRERVIAINNQPVVDANAYYQAIEDIKALGPNRSFTLQTNENLYSLMTLPAYETITLNETEEFNVTEQFFNETSNETINSTRTETRFKTEQRYIGVADIGLTVYDAPTTNIRRGLDLSGGTRVVLQPQEKIDAADIDLIVENIKQRLNVFGLSDIIVKTASDLEGNDFIIVEIAGANKDEVRELLAQQGKFEARIGNETVFFGGDKDVTYVCRSADCSGIDPRVGCGIASDGLWNCRFRFSISLSAAAAERQAAVTRTQEVRVDQQGSYLADPLDLYLDDEFVDSLQIAADLKGRAITDIEISGSGSGASQQEASANALANMKTLQTVMITGSLPVQLDIVKTDAVSPVLGEEFVKNALLIGLLSIISVVVLVFVRYREWKISLPMIITMLSEAVIILGFASLVGWNLDLAAIAAIIIAIGTGVDHQIVIADETLRKDEDDTEALSWKERIGRALFIIMAAYVTTVAAMVPLWFAGAGMLRGFAITTIIGVSIGVFVTRPAFASMVEFLVKKE